MGQDELTAVSTKLDILIDDFKSLKLDTVAALLEIQSHNLAEDKVQAGILSTVKWHSTIGSFVLVAMVSFGTFLYYRIEDLHSWQVKDETRSIYYKENRDTIIEIIENYKYNKRKHI